MSIRVEAADPLYHEEQVLAQLLPLLVVGTGAGKVFAKANVLRVASGSCDGECPVILFLTVRIFGHLIFGLIGEF